MIAQRHSVDSCIEFVSFVLVSVIVRASSESIPISQTEETDRATPQRNSWTKERAPFLGCHRRLDGSLISTLHQSGIPHPIDLRFLNIGNCGIHLLGAIDGPL
jgi:hypothetical protein